MVGTRWTKPGAETDFFASRLPQYGTLRRQAGHRNPKQHIFVDQVYNDHIQQFPGLMDSWTLPLLKKKLIDDGEKADGDDGDIVTVEESREVRCKRVSEYKQYLRNFLTSYLENLTMVSKQLPRARRRHYYPSPIHQQSFFSKEESSQSHQLRRLSS